MIFIPERATIRKTDLVGCDCFSGSRKLRPKVTHSCAT
ncbi:hypothetical protein RvY_04969 [Ramazzottius varieornatus]|uniref:Uncharacterized protein n=1 Tax=Ramazzottius varieornatus TaxID=947166 RepID=A0A1D1UTI0_RAMVA|nr:hypothetical protein RvY_04969 [Ramazzottius varieornatus]